MARITVEDCLQKVNNRFALIHMAAKRVRQLRKGSEPTVQSKNRDVVIALREIAAGNVVQGGPLDLEAQNEGVPETLPEETTTETEKKTSENEEAEQPDT